jgi:hypothetical protein
MARIESPSFSKLECLALIEGIYVMERIYVSISEAALCAANC